MGYNSVTDIIGA